VRPWVKESSRFFMGSNKVLQVALGKAGGLLRTSARPTLTLLLVLLLLLLGGIMENKHSTSVQPPLLLLLILRGFIQNMHSTDVASLLLLVIESRHSTDVEFPPAPPLVGMSRGGN